MTSKTLSRSLALAAATVALGAGVHPALAASAVGTSQAAIVAAISLTQNTNLNFGFVVPSTTTAGTVVLPLSGPPTTTGGVTYLNGATLGNWTVTGTSGEPLVVTLDTSDVIGTMTITNFVSSAPSTFTAASLTVTVGGTLNVAANQAAGNFSGVYNFTVNY
jgi:Mat/Ecp fimbriae major subunit